MIHRETFVFWGRCWFPRVNNPKIVQWQINDGRTGWFQVD
jgi:hypothetical protein